MGKFAINGFSEAEARKIIKNYLDKAKRGSDGKINETISAWFPAQNFLNFADELRKEIAESEMDPSKPIPSGVRIYFANYGDNVKPDNDAYKHQNTVVFVSTKEEKKTVNGTSITVHRDYYTPAKKNEDNKFLPAPMNRGALCPPDTNCDCDIVLDGDLC